MKKGYKGVKIVTRSVKILFQNVNIIPFNSKIRWSGTIQSVETSSKHDQEELQLKSHRPTQGTNKKRDQNTNNNTHNRSEEATKQQIWMHLCIFV